MSVRNLFGEQVYDRSRSTFKLAGGKVGGKERMQVYMCMHVRKGGVEGGKVR